MLTARSSSPAPCKHQFAEMWAGKTFGSAVKIGQTCFVQSRGGGLRCNRDWETIKLIAAFGTDLPFFICFSSDTVLKISAKKN